MNNESTAVVDEPTVMKTLEQVIDPEIGCNIVDLGLIYGVQIDGGKVTIQMTLTTPGCPMSDSLAWGVKMALLNLDNVKEADVQIVWDPPWHPSMMSEFGRAHVGMA